MKNIRYFLIYISLLVVLQMLYFSIYNIPIYKIYCELNNYYLNSQNLYDQINYKHYIYVELNNCSSLNVFSDYFGQTMISEITSYLSGVSSEISPIEKPNTVLFNKDLIYNIDKYYSVTSGSNSDYNISNKIRKVFKESDISDNQGSNLYVVVFKAATTNVNLIEFITLQNSMYIAPSETYLVFFRIYNPTDYIIKGISIYFISPNTVSVYILKIQCFCFDELLLYGFESVDLPILFYISSEIISLNLKIIAYIQIHITYLFILNNF